MKAWPLHPVIYEINTWVWLHELAQKYRQPVTLATVPEPEWDGLAAQGFDAVWLMGVWTRSPAGIEISMRNRRLLDDFRRALPDFATADNVGSPYCGWTTGWAYSKWLFRCEANRFWGATILGIGWPYFSTRRGHR